MFLTGKVCLVNSNEFGFRFVFSLLCWVISCVLKRFRSAVLSLGGVAGGVEVILGGTRAHLVPRAFVAQYRNPVIVHSGQLSVASAFAVVDS